MRRHALTDVKAEGIGVALTRHTDAGVRAKCANLIGNLSRHSAVFYPHILKHNILPPLMDCCRESSPHARKFACFAVGNAAFHSDALYQALRPCVPWLTSLLRDGDEKTRANAAGMPGIGVMGQWDGDNVRVCTWLFCRCVQELSATWHAMRTVWSPI
jgi:hypothetical protein